jgi:hypothetical protein
VVGGHHQHHGILVAFAQGERGKPVRVGGAPRRRFEDQVLGVDLGKHPLDDVALADLRQHENLAGDLRRPIVGFAQQRPAALPKR